MKFSLPIYLDGRASGSVSLVVKEELGVVHRLILDLLPVIETKNSGAHGHTHNIRFELELPCGSHTVELQHNGEMLGSGRLDVVPRHAFLPPGLSQRKRFFGVSLQLYAIRSERNWGMGDFTDLKHIVLRAAQKGADVVGVNPLHALLPANPFTSVLTVHPTARSLM